MITCQECKHYNPPELWDGDEDFGYCQLSRSEDGNPINPTTLAFARDAEKYAANLRVKPAFGCNQGVKN